jgi:outer membrane protein assembly factor BamB
VEASFWNSGAAPAADNNGNIFLAAGNGSFDYNTGGGNLGQSYIRLSTQHGLKFEDYFAPFDVVHMNRHDIDLGSSGILVLPDDVGSALHPHLLVGAAKDGRIYLIDRDHMGGHHSDSDSQVVQSFTGAITQFVYLGKPAYFNGSVYFCGTGNSLKQFPISDGKLETSARSQTTAQFEFPGCVPTISANGKADAILWLLESKGVLRAYDPSNLSNELYDSNQVATRDALGAYVKFSVPIVANGKVYAGTQDALVAYGLLSQDMRSASPTSSKTPH